MARILVADDDSEVRDMICQILQREGHETLAAADGAEALALYKQESVDIIITDIIMPEKEGLETVWEIRRDYPNSRIIAISGGGRVEPGDYLKSAVALGADSALAKPFKRRELLDRIDELLAKV
jgi:CheY-like chemotaxis protein